MPRTTSAEDYQELGKTYYKQKQYAKALSAFSNGLEAAKVPTVSLYDYRAACHEKLADFTAAVKDGREAIRLNKRDVRGYLRTASALQKLNRMDAALGIYKYGMKNVPASHQDYKFLQKMHDNLTRKLSPPKAIDPFTILPVELVELILAYLPFRNIVNTLRVSKGWKHYITGRPNLWRDIDLSEASRPVSRGFMNKAVNYAERDVTRVALHKFHHTDMIPRIATACRNLREVEILSSPGMLSETFVQVARGAVGLKKFVVKPDITLDTITQIMSQRPTLEHVEFHSVIGKQVHVEWQGPFRQLHTIALNSDASRTLIGGRLFEQTPNLQNLSLTGWKYGFNFGSDLHPYPYNTIPALLTILEIKRIDLPIFPPLPPTLKRFVLHPSKPLFLPSDSSVLVEITPSGQAPITTVPAWHYAHISHLPHLTHLTLCEMGNLNPYFLQILLDRYKDPKEGGDASHPTANNGGAPLQHIWLCGVLDPAVSAALFSPTGLFAASPRILTPALQSLRLPSLPCTDDDIEDLVTMKPSVVDSLQVADVSSTKISGASLKMLVDAVPQLQFIKADNCRMVSSRDAVTYVEGKGVGISCKMNDGIGAGGGKKVRYG
ncbi:unnamed protein product [Periconia digitata]|uniref:F-box domain-containing protein n=1 Tax=Periconia digitata TaxID=1303443 RepID=A0A9W4URG1_9PLEO|nr:unnamed protein product [Periconia digitata]